MKNFNDASHDDDGAFERYVAFHTSAGARFEFWTGVIAVLLGLPAVVVAFIGWLASASGVVAWITYMPAGVAGLFAFMHGFAYFWRRNAWIV
jgi:hypothetical protein